MLNEATFSFKDYDMKYSNEVTINRPIDKAVALYLNPNNLKEWQPGLISIELLKGEKGNAGAISKLHYQMGKRTIEMTETILTNNLPENFTATFETKGVYNLQKNRFEKINDHQTKYISESEFQFRGFAKLYGLLMPKAFKKQSQKYLDSFKVFAEQSNL